MKKVQDNLERVHLKLNKDLLILKAPKGILACGYISLDVCNLFCDASVIVRGVSTYDDMLEKIIQDKDISNYAKHLLGVKDGDTGAEALRKMGGVFPE